MWVETTDDLSSAHENREHGAVREGFCLQSTQAEVKPVIDRRQWLYKTLEDSGRMDRMAVESPARPGFSHSS